MPDIEPNRLAEMLEDAVVQYRQDLIDEFQDIQEFTESPIEEMMLWALMLEAWKLWRPAIGHIVFSETHYDTPHECVAIVPQYKFKDYRLDFFICMKAMGRKYVACIECDGHEFHERTKEQAARDKSRDRLLTAAGFKVMRFTGSEIYNDPLKCAREVYDMLARLI